MGVFLLGIPAVARFIQAERSLIQGPKQWIAVFAVGMLIVGLSSWLDVRSNRAIYWVLHLQTFILTCCTYYYVARLSTDRQRSAWSIRRLSAFLPSLAITKVMSDQDPESKFVPISFAIWLFSVYGFAPSIVGLAKSFVRQSSSDMDTLSTKTLPTAKTTFLRLVATLGLIGAMAFLNVYFANFPAMYSHFSQEFYDGRLREQLNQISAAAGIRVKRDIHTQRLYSMQLTPETPNEIFSFLPQDSKLLNSLQIGNLNPKINLAMLPPTIGRIEIADSHIAPGQIETALDMVNSIVLRRVSVRSQNSSGEPAPIVGIRQTTSIRLDECPAGTLSQIIEICRLKGIAPAISLYNGRLNDLDLVAIASYQTGVFYYFDKPSMEAFLNLAALSPQLPGSPTRPFRIEVSEQGDWTPEHYPILWEKIVNGDWHVNLPQVPPETFFLGIISSPHAPPNQDFDRRNLLEKNESEESLVLTASDLLQLHWLYPSNESFAREPGELDSLWLPDPNLIRNLDPCLRPQIRHLSFNRTIFERLAGNSSVQDIEFDVKESENLFEGFLNLETLDLAGGHRFKGPLPRMPKLKRLACSALGIGIQLHLVQSPLFEELVIFNFPFRVETLLPLENSPNAAVTIVERLANRSIPAEAKVTSVLPRTKFFYVREPYEYQTLAWVAHRNYLHQLVRQRMGRSDE